MNIKEFKYKIFVLFIVLTFILSACQPAMTEVPEVPPVQEAEKATEVVVAPTDVPAPIEATPAPTEIPMEEETVLRVAVSGEIESLDVHQLAASRAWSVAFALYGMAFNYGFETDPATGLTYANANYQPGLFESWEKRTEGDQIVYKIKIRKGCMFESGNELTAKDVAYRFERMEGLRPWNNTAYGCTKGKDCVKILDDYTIEEWLDTPNPITDIGMRALNSMIVDSEVLKENSTTEDPWGHEYLRLNGLGVGPYRIAENTPGVEMVLVKNEDYCAPENMQGYYDKIVLKIIPDVSQQSLLLQKGEIDIAPELPAKEVLDLLDVPGVQVFSFASTKMVNLGLNNKIKPYDNPKVRQALAYAVPYQDIMDAVYLGQAQEPGGLITRGTIVSTDKYWIYEYDLEKAKQLLTEAGYPEGFEMDIVMDMSYGQFEEAAILIMDSFAKIGIKGRIIKEASSAYQEKLRKKEQPTFIYDMLSWVNDVGYTFSMVWVPTGFANYVNYENQELIDAVNEAWKVMDPDVRFPMYDPIIEILDTDVPAIVLLQPNYTVAMRDNLEGFTKYPDELARYFELKPTE